MAKAEAGSLSSTEDGIAYRDASEESPALAQLLGVATLEFGVIFHRSVQLEAGREGKQAGEGVELGDSEVALSQSISSLYVECVSLPHSIIIGLTLAVTGEDEFNVLFIVIIVSYPDYAFAITAVPWLISHLLPPSLSSTKCSKASASAPASPSSSCRPRGTGSPTPARSPTRSSRPSAWPSASAAAPACPCPPARRRSRRACSTRSRAGS